MSKIALSGPAGGTATYTVTAPTGATDRVITLPDSSGTIATSESTLVQFNASGAAPVYAARAWVNFNGTGTVAIRASGNVSSITDNGVGDYTVNFATAMPDSNYSVAVAGRVAAGTIGVLVANANSTGANVAGSCRLGIGNDNTTGADGDFVYVAIFR